MNLLSHTAHDLEEAMELYRQHHWVLWQNAIPMDICQNYKAHLQQLDTEQHFTPACIGKGAQKNVVVNIRSDRILWFSQEERERWFPEFEQALRGIMNHMNRHFF